MKGKINKYIGKFIGFSLVGGLVTLTSMLLLYILAELLGVNITVAYVASYVLSIQLSFFLNLRLVFKSKLTVKNLGYYNLTYLAGMLLGVGLLQILIYYAPQCNQTLLSYAVVPVTLIFNFFFVNLILHKKNEKNTTK